MAKEITATFHIGDKQVERLTDEHIERLSQRLSSVMSRYYSNRPEEYLRLNVEDVKNETVVQENQKSGNET